MWGLPWCDSPDITSYLFKMVLEQRMPHEIGCDVVCTCNGVVFGSLIPVLVLTSIRIRMTAQDTCKGVTAVTGLSKMSPICPI